MKQLKRIAVIYVILMMVILLGFLSLNKRYSFEKRNLIYYNDLLHKVEEELLLGEDERDIEKKFDCNIILSKEINDAELADMYRSSAFVLDLAPNGEYIGKVAWTDELNRYNDAKNGFLKSTIILWAAMLLMGFFVFIYFYLYYIKPVRELERFSVEIAKGKLDEPLPIRKNNLLGSFVEAFDLMRDRLVEARKREMESEIARKELVTELSHDIKTPVAVIKAACEVLEVKVSEKDTLEKVSTISQKADTISGLISNMMHANLKDLEKLEVKPQEENSLLVLDFLESLNQYGNIILDNSIPGCLVYMDRLRMEQAIDNVIGNSRKYAGTDIHVQFDQCAVDLAEEGMKAEFLRIRIKDSGPGVSEKDIPLIAEKYYRGSNAKETSGSGLGFYLVKYYMEKQGGGLEYYNDNGFTVELLLRKV